jgi:hypothetical protein
MEETKIKINTRRNFSAKKKWKKEYLEIVKAIKTLKWIALNPHVAYLLNVHMSLSEYWRNGIAVVSFASKTDDPGFEPPPYVHSGCLMHFIHKVVLNLKMHMHMYLVELLWKICQSNSYQNKIFRISTL